MLKKQKRIKATAIKRLIKSGNIKNRDRFSSQWSQFLLLFFTEWFHFFFFLLCSLPDGFQMWETNIYLTGSNRSKWSSWSRLPDLFYMLSPWSEASISGTEGNLAIWCYPFPHWLLLSSSFSPIEFQFLPQRFTSVLSYYLEFITGDFINCFHLLFWLILNLLSGKQKVILLKYHKKLIFRVLQPRKKVGLKYC